MNLNSRKKTITNALIALSDLNDAIFVCYLAKDYKENYFSYEENIQKESCCFLKKIQQVRSKNINFEIIDALECLYAISLSFANLLNRIDDHSTFEIVNKDFSAIAPMISLMLNTVSDEIVLLTEPLYELEEVYQSALQVVVPDPLVFLIFIHDLYAFNEKIIELRVLLR